MKKLFVLLFCVGSTVAQAQFLLPKIGATYSSVVVDDDDFDTEYKLGVSFGIAYNIRINELLSVQPELNFVQKGYSTSSTYSGLPYGGGFYTVNTSDETKMNYLQVPVLVKVTFGKFYLNAGPSVGLGLNGKGKDTYSETGEDMFGSPYEYNNDNQYDILFEEAPEGYEGPDTYIENRMNISVQVGGGVTLMDKLNIDLRYGMGLTDLYDNYKMQHRVFQVTLGVPIRL